LNRRVDRQFIWYYVFFFFTARPHIVYVAIHVLTPHDVTAYYVRQALPNLIMLCAWSHLLI